MTENYTLTDDDEAWYLTYYPNHGKVWSVAPAQACQDMADAIRNNRPKPFTVGDIVHLPDVDSDWARNCEILLVVAVRETPGAVIREGDGDIDWYELTELAQGENPND